MKKGANTILKITKLKLIGCKVQIPVSESSETIVDPVKDSPPFLDKHKKLVNCLSTFLVEAFELRMHVLDELGGVVRANCCRVCFIDFIKEPQVGFVLPPHPPQRRFQALTGHAEVLMHCDVFDGITRVACHVMEVDVVSVGSSPTP